MNAPLKILAAGTCLLAALTLTGCGGTATSKDETDEPTQPAVTAPAAVNQDVDLTIRGKTITPNNQRITAKVGSTITLHVDADHAGEIHVHSTPEQHLDYAQGTSTLYVALPTPGVVAIEDHSADITILRVEVS